MRVLDATFVGLNDGFALARVRCAMAQATDHACAALLRTRDGIHWAVHRTSAFGVPGPGRCAAVCVTNVRFANDEIGYAYSADSLFLTVDGGRRWQEQRGGAIALETADGNVVRVTAASSGCPAWCNVKIYTSAIGTTRWTRAALPHPQMPLGGFGIQFVRNGSNVYLLNLGHPAGGGDRATSDLYISQDNGQHWLVRPEPCPQTHQEVDSLAIAAMPPDQVTVECAPRFLSPARRAFIAASSDGGQTFRRVPGEIPFHAIGGILAGEPSHTLVAADWTLATRFTTSRWHLVNDITNQITYAGFQNATTARVISDNQHQLWTTYNGGATWQRAAIP